jgi:hypothetical protein
VLLAEHFLAQLWQAEPRFLREDPMQSLELTRQRQ